MSQGNNNSRSRPIDVIRAVKQSAASHWQLLLPACGIDVPLKGKHGACPICGGTDRFHFIDGSQPTRCIVG
ncbi:primase-helicase zinc-binding domain-containing protein [Xenorhabdus anantnagensis]|uniref:Primase-helicase zinc-binding domain-containing protein n=1 Tax=Xenorhabdus anantnagensis TaxID=3025875 RepID=A0ABT5LRT7_9GAMM|nr:primase-helicase zinc-binding domain-containing protein [Xenorhabdus anantnagensis]MDC9597116.1 primase-helicase zinc-binding domain-containing protein [Xenorhabdus anantnagensis]